MEWHIWSGLRTGETTGGPPMFGPRTIRPKLVVDLPFDYIVPQDPRPAGGAEFDAWRLRRNQSWSKFSEAVQERLRIALPGTGGFYIEHFDFLRGIPPMLGVRFKTTIRGRNRMSPLQWAALPPITYIMDLRKDPAWSEEYECIGAVPPYLWLQREVFENTLTLFQGIPPNLYATTYDDLANFQVARVALDAYFAGWTPTAAQQFPWGPFKTM